LNRAKPAKKIKKPRFNVLARLALKFFLQNGLVKSGDVPPQKQDQPCDKESTL
jgi:hypothetical protein